MVCSRSAFALIAVAAVTSSGFAEDGVKGRIEAVTVYRGQALVTRVVDLVDAKGDRPVGLREVVVTDLPAQIEPGSIYAEGLGGVAVRSVRFRARPAEQDQREGVRKLDESIKQAERAGVVNTRMAALTQEIRAHLDGLQAFVAPAASAELKSGVLNAETIEKLSTFLVKQRERLAARELELSAEAMSITEKLSMLRLQRQIVAAGSNRQVNEAVVFIASERAGGQVRVRYLVNGASWAPSYNARREGPAAGRAAGPEQSVTLDYFASIEQTSGEDWDGVAMTLSTATPNLTATPPSLAPMLVSLAPTPQEKVAGLMNKGYEEALQDFAKQRKEADASRNRAVLGRQAQTARVLSEPGESGRPDGPAEFRRAEQALNDVADDLQLLDLVTREHISKDKKSRPTRPRDEGLSVTYTIPGMTSLPSRRDRQLVQIASLPLKAAFTKIATPVLTEYVYDEASAVNDSPLVLLAGPVTAYAGVDGGSFVGTGEIPTVASGEALTIGFGIDSSLRASRELLERTDNVQGGNRIVELTYRLAVENFGAAPAAVRIVERRPVAGDGGMTITVPTASQEAIKDGDSRKAGGIMKWDIEAPAQSLGAKAKFIEYKLRIEHDKQMSLIGMGG